MSTDNEPKQVSLAMAYKGEEVHVYLSSGTILSGVLVEVADKEARIVNSRNGKSSWVNLTHVVSISKL